MLCPLLSRYQVDPATGKGEWSHLECLGAQCKFYNVPEAECQLLLSARAGGVSLPAGVNGDTQGLARSSGEEMSQAVQGALQRIERQSEETRQRVEGSAEDAADRMKRLEQSLAPVSEIRKVTDRLGRIEESAEAIADLRKAMERLASEDGRGGGRKELKQIGERLASLESSLGESVKTLAARQSEQWQAVEASRREILEAIRGGEEARASREEERGRRAEQQGEEIRGRLGALDGAQEEIRGRLGALDTAQQEALHALQAFRDAVSALPSRQEALAERIQNGLEEGLRAQQESLGGRLAEELKAHAGEQLRHIEAANEDAVRNHGRLAQALKKSEQTQQEALGALREELSRLTAGAGEVGQSLEKISGSVGQVLAVVEHGPAEMQALGKQLRELHQFTHAALDASRQRADGLWSQVETVGRSIGQLALIVKGLQEEIERANGSLASVRNENKSLLLAFHEQKMAGQEEQRRQQVEQARELNNKGVSLFHRGSLEAAIEAFIRAVELKPDYAEAFNNLGLAYSKRGQSEEAVRYFQKALEIDPQLGEVYNNLGFLFHTSGKYERAVEMFTRSLQTGADQAIAYTNLGNTFYKMKQNERAVAAWKKALEIDPLNESARRGLAMFHQEPAPPAAVKS